MDYYKNFLDDLVKYTNLDKIQIESMLEIPPNPEMGDVAFPCFTLAKELKKAPNIIANELKQNLSKKTYLGLKEIKVIGPYLNFYYDEVMLINDILEKIQNNQNFEQKPKNDKSIVIEYPAPNSNKPLHLGHLRNICLGFSISRIFRSQGYEVHEVNLVNDRGTHICKSMLAYQLWANNEKPNKKSDHFVGDYYVLFNKKLKENPQLEDQAQKMLQDWEDGKKEVIDLWKKMRKWAIDGFNQTFKRLNLIFEKEYYESDIYLKGKDIILDGLKKGLFQKDDTGAIFVDLGKLGKKYLIRKDGTSIYITQDIYLAKKKYEDFKYDKSIYVVANEQNHHFQVLFKILKILGYKTENHHLNYGYISLPSGKMKSREGTVVDADTLLDNLKEQAKDEIKKRNDLVTKSQLDEISEKIAQSALRYYLLKYTSSKDFVFDPKESLSFEGETGPYVQYSYVRAKRILEKSNIDIGKLNINNFSKEDLEKLNTSYEISLVKKMGELNKILEDSANSYSPHILANYAYSLSSIFNSFYENCSVLELDDETLKNLRLVTLKSYTKVIEKVLYYLGIEAVFMM